MAKKKNQKKNKRIFGETKRPNRFAMPEKIKRWIWGILLFLIAIIITFSFFDLAGAAGRVLMRGFVFLVGKTVFIIPLIFAISAGVFLITEYKRFLFPLILAISFLVLGISGILGSINWTQNLEQPALRLNQGGWLGYIFSLSLLKLFGFWITQIIFLAIIFIGTIIFWQLLKSPFPPKTEGLEKEPPKPSFIKKLFTPKFKVKEIEPFILPKTEKVEPHPPSPELKTKPLEPSIISGREGYQFPSLELLETDRERPSSGDTRVNSAIIKKTLENFDIPVEMSEINIGPTVTQYTLKPAEGVKLSKITTLSNDLALALASHPIRIEAPIPGRALVGIEVPNKVRARVRLRSLIESPAFQNSPSNLTIALGRNVSGLPVYADLAKMPHLLVAGSTGTGKTIFLNSLLLSLLYKNSPEILRIILVDPKRVEFPVYNKLPHLLAPVIYNASHTCNALKWLIGEMERRFDVLSVAKARDIASYNEIVAGTKKYEAEKNEDFRFRTLVMPYIILVIDELADLMAAKGREVEAGIVRIAQMARAVGIHLVVATQRPSVEVITGLIKANITSRITFQVASQVDSRTVLDMAGAEKLLGSGDMLYVSAETAKPRRIQGVYISEKETKKVVNYIKEQGLKIEVQKTEKGILGNELAEDLERTLIEPEAELKNFYGEEDPLYEEARRVVIEARKASASLLQRRLRIGYARAARLIDMLEEKGVVGPGEGAKPREVYLPSEENLKS